MLFIVCLVFRGGDRVLNAEATEKYDGEDAKTLLRQLRERQLPLITKQICELEGEERRLSEEVEGLREVVERARSREAADLLQKIGRRDSLQREIGEKRAAITHALSERGASSLEELEGRLSELAGRAEEIRRRIEGELQRCLEEIGLGLKALSLP